MSNIKDGMMFEKTMCKFLQHDGWWALRIPKNETGAQPFDILALKNGIAFALDCKVLSDNVKRFPLSRIEDNQWLSMRQFILRNPMSDVGIAVLNNDNVYFLRYEFLCGCRDRDARSVTLSNNHLLMDRYEERTKRL